MLLQGNAKLKGGIFITFSGNCKKALTFYQNCFGGKLFFQTFEKELPGFPGIPVISGSLISESIIIHGSDLVPHEGRKTGNYLSIFLNFNHADERRVLIEKLKPQCNIISGQSTEGQKLIELTDAFDVRWILSI